MLEGSENVGAVECEKRVRRLMYSSIVEKLQDNLHENLTEYQSTPILCS